MKVGNPRYQEWNLEGMEHEKKPNTRESSDLYPKTSITKKENYKNLSNLLRIGLHLLI